MEKKPYWIGEQPQVTPKIDLIKDVLSLDENSDQALIESLQKYDTLTDLEKKDIRKNSTKYQNHE